MGGYGSMMAGRMAQNGQGQDPAADTVAALHRGSERPSGVFNQVTAPADPNAIVTGKPQQLQAKLRQIGSKTFYYKDNRWIDSTVKPEEDAKAQIIHQFSDKFFELARSQSAELNQYLTFTEPVTLKLAGTVYRIEPAERNP